MEIRVKEHKNYWSVDCSASGSIDIPKDGRWAFNGDYERPTFAPSMNETRGKAGQSHADFEADPHPWRNHVFIRDGFIEYLSDCTHEWAGKRVEIEPIPIELIGYYYPNGLKGEKTK